MKKRLLIVGALLISIILALVLVGCTPKNGQEATQTQEGTSEESTAETSPESKEVYELKFSYWSPETLLTGQFHKKAAQMIEEKTNGRVKITMYYNQSLISYPDTYVGLAGGVADLSAYQIDTTMGAHSLNRIYNMPFISPGPDQIAMTKIYQELLNKFPELQQENEESNTKWLAIKALSPYHMHTTKKPVKFPEDLKGFKMCIAANPAEMTAMMKEVGAALVPSVATANYENLAKGIIDGTLTFFTAIDGFKFDELLNYHLLIGESGLAQGAYGIMVNLDTWNRLPADIQKIIEETYQWEVDEIAKGEVELERDVINRLREEGKTFVELTPEEAQKWHDLAMPFIEQWIKDSEAKGWPARKVFEERERLISEYLKK